ncbi:nickel-dependent hydrogenase large subunit [Escherichia coli]
MGTCNLADRVPWCRFYRSAARGVRPLAAIRDGKIDLYQCVVPTTWNASPRDPKGQIGAYEAALMNTKMAIPEQPLEIRCSAQL